jgi:hypothetical protein
MQVEITNTSGLTLNALDAITGGVGVSAVYATGGQRKYPLPYPFGHIGPLLASGTYTLPVHLRDLDKGGPVSYAEELSPSEQWNQMIQEGYVTWTITTETTVSGVNDITEIFVHDI